jgi:hypothetical protein
MSAAKTKAESLIADNGVGTFSVVAAIPFGLFVAGQRRRDRKKQR